MKTFLLEYIYYLKDRKKIFLVPIMIVFIVLGFLMVFTSGSAVAPFIYTLF